MLSPENYIRQKARRLPLHECRINKDWEDSGLAYISVARKHANGNITMGMFLVDLKLLGVKDALYQFNISELEYREVVEELNEKMDTEVVSYTLAHNIIYAGVEFAEDYGFKPHKDFTSVARYILEEDSDAIELIEIECGENDMPLYVRGPFETETRARQIIAQLEAKAGPGNYKVVWLDDEDFFEEDPWDDESDFEDKLDEMEERFEDVSIDERVDLILDRLDRIKKLSEEEREELGFLTNSVIEEYVDFELLSNLNVNITDKLPEYDIAEDYSDEILGIFADGPINREDWSQQFDKLIELAESAPKSAGKRIKKLKKEMPGNPALAYLELIVLQQQEHSLYEERLNDYYRQHPGYSLIKLLWTTHLCLSGKKTNPIDLFKKGPEEFFAGQEALHPIELFYYFVMLISFGLSSANITLLEMVDNILVEIDVPGYDEALSEILTIGKISFLRSLKEEPFSHGNIQYSLKKSCRRRPTTLL